MDRSVIMSCGCEAACGQQLRIVGATTSQCQTRPGVPLNALFFFLKAVSFVLPGWNRGTWEGRQSLCLCWASMFPPRNSTDLLCLWPQHGCHHILWPNSPAVPTCTEKWCLGAGLPSAIPPRLASAAGRLNVPELHLRGWHSQLKLLTLDVYCIFLKKYLFVNSVYVLIFFWSIT